MNDFQPITLDLKSHGIQIVFSGRSKVVAQDLTELAHALELAAQQAVVAHAQPMMQPVKQDQDADNSAE